MRLSRRRFLVAAAAAALLPGARPVRWEWRGSALGAEARIILEAPRERAEAAAAMVVAEIERLERIFSLHRAGSELSRLNASGLLAAPAVELTDTLAAALRWRSFTGGAFDPAVQPLWDHFARGRGDIGEALERVRRARIELAPAALRLAPGTALTLNGIAQGTIADRVASLLAREGFAAPLVDTGEMRLAPGRRQRVRLPAADLVVELDGVALATSEPGALVFDAKGSRHHLFDPASGASPHFWRSVTVVAPSAEMADALSTAFAVSPREAVGDLAASLPDVAVLAIAADGTVHRFGARGLAWGTT